MQTVSLQKVKKSVTTVKHGVTSMEKSAHFIKRLRLRQVIGLILLIVIFCYLALIISHDWVDILNHHWRFYHHHFLLAFLSYSIALMFAAWGWSLFFQKLTNISGARLHLKYYVYTNLIRRVPLPLLYLLGRIYIYEKRGVTRSTITVISLLEWLMILLSGFLLSLWVWPFITVITVPPNWHNLWLMAGLCLVGFVLVHPRILAFLFKRIAKGNLVSITALDVLTWLAIYSLVWINGGLAFYFIINTLYPLALSQFPYILGIWTLSGVVTTLFFSLSPAFGLKELTLVALLIHFVPSYIAVAIALLMRAALILFESIWSLIAIKI